jgi:predicted dinucleotide-binding enzyme
MSTKVAIVGKGNVGSALQEGLQKAGYEVRTTGSDQEGVRAVGAWGDIIVLAVPASARRDVIEKLGDVSGKVVVDPTNLLKADWSYAGDLDKSGAEELQEWAPGARVVKAFNTVFARNMSTGRARGEPISLFVAGDDEDAKRQVMEMGRAIGFVPVDAGPLSHARYLEVLGVFNIQLAYGPTKYGTDIGFRLVGVGG